MTMQKTRRVLTLLGESGEIGLTTVEQQTDSAIWIWGVTVFAAISLTSGIVIWRDASWLGPLAYIPAVGLFAGGFVLTLRLLETGARIFCALRDERAAALHTKHLAQLQRRRLSIQVSTIEIPPLRKNIPVSMTGGKNFEIESEQPELIDVGAAECKAQAIALLRASEVARAGVGPSDRVMRWSKLGEGWSPAAWTSARDSLKPLLESNPAGLPNGTYCVAAEFMTVALLLAAVESGRVLPSPSGAVVIHERTT